MPLAASRVFLGQTDALWLYLCNSLFFCAIIYCEEGCAMKKCCACKLLFEPRECFDIQLRNKHFISLCWRCAADVCKHFFRVLAPFLIVFTVICTVLLYRAYFHL